MMQSLDETAVLKCLQEPSPRAFLLLFYTTQCSQCKIAHARIERVIQKGTFEVDFFKCNLDEAPAISEYFGIRSVPICMTYNQKGDPKSRLLGF